MKTIAVYNLKGGVGKTATAVNLAYLSALSGARTCLWDLDPQAAASWYMNCKPRTGFKFSKLAKDKLSLGKQIQATEFDHLDMIPANMTYRNVDAQMAHADPNQLKEWLDSLSEIYRTVILDCPPSLSSLAELVLKHADMVLVPVLPTYLSFQTYHQLVALMKAKKIPGKKLHPVITMIDRRKKIHSEFSNNSLQKLGKDPLGFIPYSSDVEKMGEFRHPLPCFASRSAANLAYQLLWENVERKIQ
jgi:chromosome partitioning protein